MDANTKDYVVTKLAGPKVAGAVVKAGQKLTLTEVEARSELLSGAIVEAKDKDKDPLAGSKKLADIQSRAKGFDGAKDEDEQEADPPQDLPPNPPAKNAGGKGADKS